MVRVPIIITVMLAIIATLAGLYVAKCSALGLSGSELVQAEVAIAACLGAFVSATFVIYSYIRTNEAFLESQRPQLLMQVQSLRAKKEDGSEETYPFTTIHYRNLTNNRFSDLTVHVTVDALNRTFELSDLFSSNMIMIGQDQRQRSFKVLEELKNRGLDIISVSREGNEVLLNPSYEYTFNGVRDLVMLQQYRWNGAKEEWEIV